MEIFDIQVKDEPLDARQCTDWVMCPESGGIDIFIGTVRSQTKGKRVLRLEFEAYKKMAESEIRKIVEDSFRQWLLHKVLVHHRTGILGVGEVPVVIAVSAAHRDAAFDACRYAIDTLKQTVPIWKKEVFEDGEHCVAAHP